MSAPASNGPAAAGVLSRQFARLAVALVTIATLAAATSPARAWDSATHRMIARFAVEALPPCALKTTFSRNEVALEGFSVEPDSALKRNYGKAEERKHYINIEWFGSDPFSSLDPDINVMRRRVGDRVLKESGTLPWAIEQVSDDIESAWRRDDCERAIRLGGYLAHYVGDASQPLHSTIRFDGYPRDKGIHARFERAVDDSLASLGPTARAELRIEPVTSVWAPVIAEIRDANGLVGEVIHDDRAARDLRAFGSEEYRRAMMHDDAPVFARQLARASSVLGSLWLYEWTRAGKPDSCANFFIHGQRWPR